MSAIWAKELFYRDYTTEYGMGRLEPNKPSDNPILWLAQMLYRFKKAEIIDKRDTDNAFFALENCVVIKDGQKIRGLHWRSPDSQLLEAHDNLVAIAAISVLIESVHAREMCDRGNKYGWSFHSKDPEKQEIRTTLQGGTICFIKLCAGYNPYPIEFIWMLLGILNAGVKKYTYKWFKGNVASTVNINWLVIDALDEVYKKKFTTTHWTYLPYQIVRILFKSLVNSQGGIYHYYRNYFKPEHPIHLFEKVLDGERYYAK